MDGSRGSQPSLTANDPPLKFELQRSVPSFFYFSASKNMSQPAAAAPADEKKELTPAEQVLGLWIAINTFIIIMMMFFNKFKKEQKPQPTVSLCFPRFVGRGVRADHHAHHSGYAAS